MTEDGLSNQRIRNILESTETIAMVGLSGNWSRPSYFAAKYLMEKGYTVIPVNPNYKEILGKKSFPSLREIDRPVDVVNLFQRSEKVSDFLEDAMALKASAFWMQLGIVNKQAGGKAVDLGMVPVMDRCMKMMYLVGKPCLLR